jgi:hypothetical protein
MVRRSIEQWESRMSMAVIHCRFTVAVEHSQLQAR